MGFSVDVVRDGKDEARCRRTQLLAKATCRGTARWKPQCPRDSVVCFKSQETWHLGPQHGKHSNRDSEVGVWAGGETGEGCEEVCPWEAVEKFWY